jgi:hypothetical protein
VVGNGLQHQTPRGDHRALADDDVTEDRAVRADEDALSDLMKVV